MMQPGTYCCRMTTERTIGTILVRALQMGSSDVHLKAGSPPAARVNKTDESRDEPSARHSPVSYIHGRVLRKWTPGLCRPQARSE